MWLTGMKAAGLRIPSFMPVMPCVACVPEGDSEVPPPVSALLAAQPRKLPELSRISI